MAELVGRAELERALDEGWTVDVDAVSYRQKRDLPKDPPDSEEGIQGTIIRDPEGRLTREGMELAVARGGSVLHDGEPVNDLERLPSAAELARHDERRAQQVRSTLLAQRASVDAELAKLDAPRPQGIQQEAPRGGAPAGQPHPQPPRPGPRPRPPTGRDAGTKAPEAKPDAKEE